MKTLFTLILISALVLQPLCADDIGSNRPLQPSPPSVRNALHTVINAQIAAFRHQNYARAYTFAASDLQKIFSLETFQSMVQDRYPIIAGGVKTAFGPTLDNGEEGIVYVQVIDEKGDQEVYEYQLIREGKSWKISGVAVSELPSQTV